MFKHSERSRTLQIQLLIVLYVHLVMTSEAKFSINM